MEQNLEVKPLIAIRPESKLAYYSGFLIYSLMVLLLLGLFYYDNVLFSGGTETYFAIVFALSILFFLRSQIIGYKKDGFTIMSDRNIHATNNGKSQTFSVDKIKRINYWPSRESCCVYSFEKDSVSYDKELFVFYSHIYLKTDIQKTLQKLKELKPDIEFDEESQKILDGEFK